MQQESKLIHAESLRLRWGEMDMMQHLNNVSYFRYFEEARISWFRATGFAGAGDAESAVLGSITCRFVKPAVYPADVVVELRAGRVGNSSFGVTHVMRDAVDPAVVYAHGEAVLVWIETATGRPVPVPEGIRKILQS